MIFSGCGGNSSMCYEWHLCISATSSSYLVAKSFEVNTVCHMLPFNSITYQIRIQSFLLHGIVCLVYPFPFSPINMRAYYFLACMRFHSSHNMNMPAHTKLSRTELQPHSNHISVNINVICLRTEVVNLLMYPYI